MTSPSGSHEPSSTLLERVTRRAREDPTFRQRLLEDPAGAVRESFGIEFPGAARVRFIERPADVDALFVLEPLEASDGALRDDELDAVAGGVGLTAKRPARW